MSAQARKCIHDVPLSKPCRDCREIEENRRGVLVWERALRGTPLGRLCGLKGGAK